MKVQQYEYDTFKMPASRRPRRRIRQPDRYSPDKEALPRSKPKAKSKPKPGDSKTSSSKRSLEERVKDLEEKVARLEALLAK